MFDVFVRSWWKANPSWPDGREPGPGRKRYLAKGLTNEDEAFAIAKQYNDTHHPGHLSRKAEVDYSKEK